MPFVEWRSRLWRSEKSVYVAGCCNGLGTVKGTLYGKLVADLATGRHEPWSVEAAFARA